MKLKLLGLIIGLVLSCASPAAAITYNINITDTSGDVALTGTITTDGTLGPLMAPNIVDYNLTLKVFGFSSIFIDRNCIGGCSGTVPDGYSILQTFGSPVILPAFTASATSLYFDFSSTSHNAINLDSFTNAQMGMWDATFGNISSSIGLQACTYAGIFDGNSGCSKRVYLAASGVVALDQATNLSLIPQPEIPPLVTPLPAALGLFLSGILFTGFFSFIRRMSNFFSGRHDSDIVIVGVQ